MTQVETSVSGCQVHVPSSALQMSRGNASGDQVVVVITVISSNLFQVNSPGRTRTLDSRKKNTPRHHNHPVPTSCLLVEPFPGDGIVCLCFRQLGPPPGGKGRSVQPHPHYRSGAVLDNSVLVVETGGGHRVSGLSQPVRLTFTPRKEVKRLLRLHVWKV